MNPPFLYDRLIGLDAIERWPGRTRVARGGSNLRAARHARLAARPNASKEFAQADVGLRPARTIDLR